MRKPLAGTYEDHWTTWIPETPEDVDMAAENLTGAAMAGARPAKADKLGRLYNCRCMIKMFGTKPNVTFKHIMDGIEG